MDVPLLTFFSIVGVVDRLVVLELPPDMCAITILLHFRMKPVEFGLRFGERRWPVRSMEMCQHRDRLGYI